MYCYSFSKKKELNVKIEDLLDGDNIKSEILKQCNFGKSSSPRGKKETDNNEN